MKKELQKYLVPILIIGMAICLVAGILIGMKVSGKKAGSGKTDASSRLTAASAASTGSSDAQTAAATTASAAASGAQAAGTDTQDAGKDNYDYMAHQPQLPDGVVSTLYGNDGLMQIVCIGDSQYANFKGADGLGALLSHYCKANVFNLGLGGATAAVTPTEGSASVSRSGCGVVSAICGDTSPDKVFASEDSYARSIFDSCDFTRTDVFVIAFGVNDYLRNIPLTDDNMRTNVRAYRGALAYMVMKLQNKFPNAQIVVVAPGYCQFFEGGTGAYLGDGNIRKNKQGYTVSDLVDVARNFADNNVGFMDTYELLGINSYNAKEMLLDGIHMTHAAVACREILPRGLLTAGNACHASERFAAACFMQYERHRVSCIEKSRRNGKTGAYCIEINEIYAIRARSANMSWKIYADEQAAPLLH